MTEELQISARGKHSTIPTDLVSNLQTLARGAGINSLGYGSRVILLYVYSFTLARLLGPDGLGLYSLTITTIFILSQIGDLGLKSSVMRFVGAYVGEGQPQQANRVLRIALLSGFITSIVLGVGLWSVSEWLATHLFQEPTLANLLRLAAPGVGILVLGNILAAFTQALRVMKYKVLIQDVLQLLLQLAAVMLFLWLGFQVHGAVAGYLMAGFVAVLLLLYVSTRILPPGNVTLAEPVPVTSLLRFSMPILIANVLAVLSARINLLMVGMFLDSSQVGIYDVAFQVTVMGTFFLTSFNMVFAPMAADLSNRKQHDALQELYQIATRWILTLALPMFAAIVLLASPILYIFGAEFTAGTSALIILTLGQIVSVGVGSVSYLLVMAGRPKLVSFNNLVGLILTVSLNVWLVPRLGLVGAAWAQAAMIAIVNLLGLIEVRYILGLQPYTRHYRKPVLAIIGAFVGTYGVLKILLNFTGTEIHHVLAQIILVSGVLFITYLVLLLVQGLEPAERMILHALVKKVRHL